MPLTDQQLPPEVSGTDAELGAPQTPSSVQSPIMAASEEKKPPPWIAVVISCVALVVSAISGVSSWNSSQYARQQFLLASRPHLYGECSNTITAWLKGSPLPDLIFRSDDDGNPFTVLEFLRPIAPEAYVLALNQLPFQLARCAVTNLGKGIAEDVTLDMRIEFETEPIPGVLSSGWPEQHREFRIPILGPNASFVFLVANSRTLTAHVRPGLEVTYRLASEQSERTEPISHNPGWNELILRDSKRPKGFK